MDLKKYELKNMEIMKYLQFKTILCVVIFLIPGVLCAQNTNSDNVAESTQDSVEIVNRDQFRIADSALVQTAFSKVPREDLLGGISVVSIPGIMQRDYMTYSLENMQAFVGGFNGNIWGMSNYLVLVDGVPRDASSVNPSAIKQISFLKGISATVLYGSRASNGVIYITTKRGGNNDLQISGRVDGGVDVPKSYPNYLGSAEYMKLYNEARQNDGLESQYSSETISNYASANNSYQYPSVDYYSPKYLKDFSKRYHGNVGISGGNEAARYYTNIDFLSTGSLLNFGEAKGNRTNSFNIRGNVDFQISDNIDASVGTGVIYDNQQGVNTNYWGGASTLRPNRYTPLIPISMFEDNNSSLQKIVDNSNYVVNGKYLLGGTQLIATNPIASVYAGGTNQSVARQFQFNTAINMDLKGLLEGLKFKTRFGVDYASSYDQAYNNQYSVYEPSWSAGNNQINSLTQYGEDSKTGIQNISNSTYQQTLAFSGQFNYNRTLNNDQRFTAMLIANTFQITETGVYHRTANANLGLQLRYDYHHKYYADFSAAAPRSAKLPEGNRWAFSPTATLGWRISQEGFMSGSSAINNLMLTVSAGVVNTDMSIPGYYLYESSYTQANGAYFSWRDGSLRRGTESRRGPNPDLTYVKRKEVNAGVDAAFFNNLFTVNASVFFNRMDGGVVQASALYPSYFTTGYPDNSFIPYINYNVDQRKGIDFNVNVNKELAGIDWSLGVAGTYFDSKAVKRAEVNQYNYQNTQGKPLDAIWGLQSKGFFMSQEDINNYEATQQFGTVEPGDIKYVDQNGDGVINSQDQVYLGKAGWNGAPMTFGVNLTARWKSWTLFVLGTGQFGTYGVKNGDYYWVNGNNKYSNVVEDRWTPETSNTATYPRLTTQAGSNNFRTSSFWMYSTDRFDLQKIQLSFDLPPSVLSGLSLQQIQIYVTGSNLLTISDNKEIMELNLGGPPQSRFYNVGVKANF